MSSALKPVVDFRTYKIRRGGMPLFLQLAETHVFPVMDRHVGPPIAYYVSDIGPQDEVVHLWGYDSLGDMEERRRARNQDPQWPGYVTASDMLIDWQFTRIVRRMAVPLPEPIRPPSPDSTRVELRVTTVRRGTVGQFQRHFLDLGLPAQLRHVGAPVSLYVAEIGPLNEIIEIWAFDSLAEYEARSTARNDDTGWAEYLKATESIVEAESTRLVRRVRFGAGR